jgi:hypothetical protein
MSLRKKFKTDAKSETEGIWLDYGDGQQIKVEEKIAYESYAKCIVLDWKGVRAEDIGDKGRKEVPFSFENCVKLFKNLPDLFDDVQAQAQDQKLFLEEVREEDSKN